MLPSSRMKQVVPPDKSTPARRKARLAAVVANAKAKGEKIPGGMGRIQFRDLTRAEQDYGKTLEPLARERSSRRKAVA